jgi:hypothetical protein
VLIARARLRGGHGGTSRVGVRTIDKQTVSLDGATDDPGFFIFISFSFSGCFRLFSGVTTRIVKYAGTTVELVRNKPGKHVDY